MSAFPPRVHVVLAREADSAVIIRRGPSKSVCTVGWDRKTDEFRLGQWLRGRIYERRCDLSPDGRHFIYFAMNGRWDSETKGSWTAISRSPYLKAIGLWASGSCWSGGGLFRTDDSFWLNTPRHGLEQQLKPSSLRENSQFPFHESYGGECPGVYYIRLQRDGWRLMRYERDEAGGACTIFERTLPKGWVLEKRAHETTEHPVGRGCYFDTHRLIHPERQIIEDHPEWEWADIDRNRLAWIENGVLYVSQLSSKGLRFRRHLHDFNRMEFKAIAAPY